MRIRGPRTITGLMAAGCLLAAAPLLGGLLYASVVLDRLTHMTEVLLDHGMATTQLGMQLRDDLSNLERSSRQYALLRDDRLQDLTERRWRDTAVTVRRLNAQPPTAATAFVAADISARFAVANANWHIADFAATSAAIDGLHTLQQRADVLIGNGRLQLESEFERVRAEAQRARRQMFACALTLIPLGGMLAWGFSVAVTRPVKQMFRAISALGRSRYKPVPTIRFPHEMHRLSQQIEWLRRRLGQLEADKERFLRQVSHELKTPLACLREGTELLSEGALGELTERQGEVASILSESTAELESLIDNLLAYSEWRAGRQESQRSWFEADALLGEVLSVHRLRLSKRALKVDINIQEPRVFALRAQIRVAVDNLITNAIKHSPPGSTIEICVAANDGQFDLSVRDYGRGVPDADKEVIFEPFVRGLEVEEQGIRGTGIGLSIVDETLLAHSGSVSVEDAYPGARFRLRWPYPHG